MVKLFVKLLVYNFFLENIYNNYLKYEGLKLATSPTNQVI